MLTQAQLAEYEAQSIVTVDTPLTAQQVAAGAAAFDELLPANAGTRTGRSDLLHPAVLPIMEHPFFEDIARQVLRASEVELFQSGMLMASPEPHAGPGLTSEHVDVSYTREDWDAVPRRTLCLCFLWMTDMPLKRAAYHYRPGSHRQLADWRSSQPELATLQPEVRGDTLDRLPALAYEEPVAATATAGQVSILTTSAVHSGSFNLDIEPRKLLVFSFKAQGVTILLPDSQQKAREAWLPKLRDALSPSRKHLAGDA